MQQYRELDHTADTGIEVFAASINELFVNAALGFFATVVDITTVSAREVETITVSASDYEELLVRWLTELLYWHEVHNMLFCEFAIIALDARQLQAHVGGERFDPKRHQIRRQIKAVTYHDLKVQQVKDGWQARVIFDI